jgi:hypothetical protein
LSNGSAKGGRNGIYIRGIKCKYKKEKENSKKSKKVDDSIILFISDPFYNFYFDNQFLYSEKVYEI